MSTDILLYNGKNDMGFDDSVTIKIAEPKNISKDRLSVVEGKDFQYNRKLIENKHLDILLSPEKLVKKDAMHHRNSGLNQVLCRLAKKNGIAIGFSFNDLLNSKKRAVLLGRMMQNVKICRKFKVMMVLGSFARNKWEIRSKSDLESFAKVLGMNDREARDALKNIEDIIENKNIKWARKGVKIIE